MKADPLGTPEEVAAYLQKPPKTLAEWRSRGCGPPYFKLGNGHIRYDWADVRLARRAGRRAWPGPRVTGPPGKRNGPHASTGRRQPPQTTINRLADASVNEAVQAKLRCLREHYGYFTRAGLGEVTPHRDQAEDWPVYDALALGLIPHPREACAACQAVGR